MKRLFISLTSLVFGALRGLYEGMTMTLSTDPMHLGTIEGVRGHADFESYHLIGAAVYAAFALLIAECCLFRPRWFIYFGIAFLSWETFELAYSFARTGALPMYEHLTFLDVFTVRITGAWLVTLHSIRTVAGISLLCLKGDSNGRCYAGICTY